MALAFETWMDYCGASLTLHVRLLDGEQVLAERTLNGHNQRDRLDWMLAAGEMQIHDALVVRHMDDASLDPMEQPETYFMAALRAIFPDFGTVPEGVALA